VWANPDVTNAAEWMRVLVERPDVRAVIGRNARQSMGHYQKEAQRALFVDELRLILESEISWGVGAERRKARRDCLERSMAEGESERNQSGPAWLRSARSLAKKAGFRRGKFPYWVPPRRGTS
jgi:hypothetical protein